MGLGNPLEIVVHHLLIGGMAGLSYWDGFSMVSALVCMTTAPSLCEIRTTPSACAKFRTTPSPCAKFAPAHACQTTSKDVFPEDERLNFWFLGVKEARITLNGQYMVSCNLCMPYWIRDQEGRLVRIENPQDTELDICVNIMDPPQEDQNSQHGQGADYKAHIVPLLPNFHGMESENPYAHIKEFEEVYGGHQCFPHHGFDTWLLVSYFYDGMSSSMKQILETMCGGDFMSKNPEEAMDFLSYVSEVSRGWDEPNSREMGKMKAPVNPKGGMYMLSEDMDMKAKVATIARRLEELELKKMHEVQAIFETQAHVMPCTICQSCDHVVDECPTMPAVREMLGDQANVVGQFRPTTMHLMETPIIQAGETIQIFLGNQDHLHTNHKPNPSTSTNLFSGASHCEPNKVMGDFVGEQRQSTPNCTKRLKMLRVLKLREWRGCKMIYLKDR
ncbi:hypothetical protein CK203_094845 [Vitis vinifera]|uniref:Retrotransposon gag domain-containing protein n=1 Tax=Vitis vinifera TaxID=29760 RepID=A0A438DCF4_VITVI|nr:hypothetical protein CK203_094845 [Vitis vinifera]